MPESSLIVDHVNLNLSIQGLAQITLPRRKIQLTRQSPSIIIGRSSDNHAKGLRCTETNAFFDSAVMSREHAKLTMDFEAKKMQVEDLGSTHGTFLREKLRPHQDVFVERSRSMQNGDTLICGTAVWRAKDLHKPAEILVEYESPKGVPTSAPTNVFIAPNYEDEIYVPSEDDEAQPSSAQPVTLDLTCSLSEPPIDVTVLEDQELLPQRVTQSEVIHLTDSDEASDLDYESSLGHDSDYDLDFTDSEREEQELLITALSRPENTRLDIDDYDPYDDSEMDCEASEIEDAKTDPGFEMLEIGANAQALHHVVEHESEVLAHTIPEPACSVTNFERLPTFAVTAPDVRRSIPSVSPPAFESELLDTRPILPSIHELVARANAAHGLPAPSAPSLRDWMRLEIEKPMQPVVREDPFGWTGGDAVVAGNLITLEVSKPQLQSTVADSTMQTAYEFIADKRNEAQIITKEDAPTSAADAIEELRSLCDRGLRTPPQSSRLPERDMQDEIPRVMVGQNNKRKADEISSSTPAEETAIQKQTTPRPVTAYKQPKAPAPIPPVDDVSPPARKKMKFAASQVVSAAIGSMIGGAAVGAMLFSALVYTAPVLA